MLTALGICAAAGVVLAVLRPVGAGAGANPFRSGNVVSYGLLCLWMVAASLNLQRRVDGTELFSEGLSTQNQLQAAVTLCLAGWALVLVTSGRVRPGDLVRGARLWLSGLVVWFAIATSWATSPLLSRYRVVELASVWVVTISAMSGPTSRRRLVAVLWTTIATGVVAAVVSEGSFDITRSNSLAPVAALLGLFGLDAIVQRGLTWPRVVAVVLPLWLFWQFDSLATAGALLVAVGAFLVGRVAPGVPRIASVSVVGVGTMVALLAARSGPTNVVEGFGAAYGKPQQFVSNWTGRLPLWEFMLADIREHPLGLGLGADRTLVLRDAAREIGWAPLHAHNGFMAALYAGGFIGLILAVAVLASAVRLVRRLPPTSQSLGYAGLALLAVNNLTINGFGSTTSPSWIIVMAVVASAATVFVTDEPPRGTDDDHRLAVPRSGRGISARRRRGDDQFVRGS